MSKPEKIVCISTEENKSEAFDRIMKGVNLLGDAVKQTLGPKGLNFLIEKSGGRITNDGITIAREIQSKDEIEDIGIRTVREAAIKTNEDAGDGTTTATVVTQAILKEASTYMARNTQFAKMSVMAIRQKIEDEAKDALEKLTAMAKPVESEEQLIDVALVSVEDKGLAEMIGKAQWELGETGVIIPEENTDPVCVIERVRGIRIDNGLGTSVLMNNLEKQRLEVDNTPILLTNHQIQTLAPLGGVIQALVDKQISEIVIVARAFSQEAIRQIMENRKNGIKIYPINAPYVNQREVMKDLEATLGGRYLHDEDSTLESVKVEDFGVVSKVLGYMYHAIFTGDPKREKEVLARIEILKKDLEGNPSKFEKKMLGERIAQMENGFAVMKVGSTSDTDRKYKFDKVEDAVNAVRSALQEGTVKGGGLAMKEIADTLPDDAILKKPLQAPYNQIMANAGTEFEIEEWVRNSAKVERLALQNATRIAADLVTVGGSIATEKMKPLDQLLKAPVNPE